jgi:hypothetical protein
MVCGRAMTNGPVRFTLIGIPSNSRAPAPGGEPPPTSPDTIGLGVARQEGSTMSQVETLEDNGSATKAFASAPATTRPPVLDEAREVTQPHQHRSGWVVYSAIMLLLAGGSRVLDAIWAFQHSGALPDNLQGAVLGTSLTTYGWVWLAVGCLLALGGIGLFVHSTLARWLGVGAAAIAAWTAFTWMPFYPAWSLVYVAMAGLVIYGLIVHWGGHQTT